MIDYKKLIEEARAGLTPFVGPFTADRGRSALSQLEVILNEVGGLVEKWEKVAWDKACAAELRAALQGGEG